MYFNYLQCSRNCSIHISMSKLEGFFFCQESYILLLFGKRINCSMKDILKTKVILFGSFLWLIQFFVTELRKLQIAWHLYKMLGSRSISDFRIACILKYLHMHNKISQGWNPSLNMKLFYVSNIPQAHSLKIILYNVLRHLHFDCNQLHEIKCGISHCAIVPMLKNFRFQSILYFRCLD